MAKWHHRNKLFWIRTYNDRPWNVIAHASTYGTPAFDLTSKRGRDQARRAAAILIAAADAAEEK